MEWLINPAAYTGAVTANTGLSLLIWNDNVGAGFNTYPRAILRFAGEATELEDWTVY